LLEKLKVYLLNDVSIKWLYKNRMDDLLQRCEENSDVEQEWDNAKKNMLRKTAEGSVRTINVSHKRRS
jgi:hypothetical protein